MDGVTILPRPPAGLEYKAAPAVLDAPPAPPSEPDAATWEGIIAVTGLPGADGVGYAPGAIGRSLARITPKGTHGRSWLRPTSIVEHAEELEPGDPRIPATLADGTPWPPTAGAVWVRLRFITGTADGRAALAAARAARPGEWALGFRALAERRRGGARVLDDLDLYQMWPRGLVDDATGPGPEVKAAGVPPLEVKAGGPIRSRPSLRDRPGLPRVTGCSVCRRPAAAVVGGGLRPGEALICADCVGVMTGALDEHVATIDPADLDAAAAVTSEQAYDQALDDEVRWDVLADGTLTRATDDPTRGRAWGADSRRARGRP